MKTITLKTESKNSTIYIGKSILNNIGDICFEKLPKAKKILVVTDSNVAKIYLEKAIKILKEKDKANIYSISFEAGEKSKNLNVYSDIIKAAAMLQFTRDDAFISLGGGVCGDITGFAAATYMRGIKYIQIPTSLLAAIDASIGGKTGVDIKEGKNLIGAFWQPEAVIFDTETLKTLPEMEYKNGLGEAIKYAILDGGDICKILKTGLDENNIEDFVYLCAQSKVNIVEKDEKEGSIRALLNLGHTIGHAEEAVSEYSIPHGMAVADGILVMVHAAKKNKEITEEEYKEIKSLIEKYDVGTGINFSLDTLMPFVFHDKKAKNDGINVVVIKGIGKCEIKKMSFEEFGEYIK